MISVEQVVPYTVAAHKRGLMITRDDILDLTQGLLKNRGYYHRYTVIDKLYNFVNNNRKDLKILLVQFNDVRDTCNLHSGLCQKLKNLKNYL